MHLEKVTDSTHVPASVNAAAAAATTPLERLNVYTKHFGAPPVGAPTSEPVLPTHAGATESTVRQANRAAPKSPEARDADAKYVSDVKALERNASIPPNEKQALRNQLTTDYFNTLVALENDDRAPPPSTTSRTPPSPQKLEASRAAPTGDPYTDLFNESPDNSKQPRDASGKFVSPQTPQATHTPKQCIDAHKSVTTADGFIPVESIGEWSTSGYKLPKFVDGQQFPVSIFKALADARRAGISQEQVTAYIRADMVSNGWIKA